MERSLAEGALGIKLWVAMKDGNGGLQRTTEVLNGAHERGLPVLVHTFTRTEPNLPGEITIEEFAALARAVPGCRLIGAHAGGNWRKATQALQDASPNACVDISGSYPERGMVETLVKGLGADRILLGSDALGRTLPSQLAKVLLADICDTDKQQILSKNAMRLFDLKNDVARPTEIAPPHKTQETVPRSTDHFCYCGSAPYWEIAPCTPAALEALLAEHDIETAHVGDLIAVFAATTARAANDAFLQTCSELQRVVPLATLNPVDDEWRSVLDAAGQRFAGAVIHPYLHNWQLDDKAHADFFRPCAERTMPLWVNLALSDHRFRNPALRARPALTDEVRAFALGAPPNQYVFQGAAPDTVEAVLATNPDHGARFLCEISRLTDLGSCLADVLAKHGPANLVMGSECPFRDLREVRFAQERVQLNRHG